MSARVDPLVVTTQDGCCWTRRAVNRAGRGLYALADVRGPVPELVLASLAELAEHGLASMADVLPVPVGPEPQALSGPICSQAEARAAGLDIAPSVAELDAMAETIVAAGDPLSAEVSLAQAVPLLGAAVTRLRARVAELEERLGEYERPADEDPITYTLTPEADGITRRIAPTQALREDPHDGPLHHDYRVGRDLPQAGGAK